MFAHYSGASREHVVKRIFLRLIDYAVEKAEQEEETREEEEEEKLDKIIFEVRPRKKNYSAERLIALRVRAIPFKRIQGGVEDFFFQTHPPSFYIFRLDPPSLISQLGLLHLKGHRGGGRLF